MTDPRPCREQERQSREMSIAAITIWLLLFFGAVSLTTSYVALRTGVLIGDWIVSKGPCLPHESIMQVLPVWVSLLAPARNIFPNPALGNTGSRRGTSVVVGAAASSSTS